MLQNLWISFLMDKWWSTGQPLWSWWPLLLQHTSPSQTIYLSNQVACHPFVTRYEKTGCPNHWFIDYNQYWMILGYPHFGKHVPRLFHVDDMSNSRSLAAGAATDPDVCKAGPGLLRQKDPGVIDSQRAKTKRLLLCSSSCCYLAIIIRGVPNLGVAPSHPIL